MRWYEDPRFNKGLKWERKDSEDIIDESNNFEKYIPNTSKMDILPNRPMVS